MADLPLRGPIRNEQSDALSQAGVLIKDDRVSRVGSYSELSKIAREIGASRIEYGSNHICIPAFIDAHTHICFAGSRVRDYAMRNEGLSYLDIARAGGGIWDTVSKTRNATQAELKDGIMGRLKVLASSGVATVEVKSGYGLNVEEELKMLQAIHSASRDSGLDIISTCLAAHIKPKDFEDSHKDYLDYVLRELLPDVKDRGLAQRVDAFVEEEAFSRDFTFDYLSSAQKLGFDLTVHADQFTTGGSALAVELNARSADHLEASGDNEIELLARSNTVAVALPGASIGLGCAFAPARQLLDKGAILAIASDWNPGSAPMGDLLVQASVLATFEKLGNLEVIAGMTYRAAAALGLNDRGRLSDGMKADLLVYDTADYNEILYHQGTMKPLELWKSGQLYYKKKL